jgi:hypothetical protein
VDAATIASVLFAESQSSTTHEQRVGRIAGR